MTILRLAGNRVRGTAALPRAPEWGRLALVLVSGEQQWEIEVRSPEWY